jgi:hypothetical protein
VNVLLREAQGRGEIDGFEASYLGVELRLEIRHRRGPANPAVARLILEAASRELDSALFAPSSRNEEGEALRDMAGPARLRAIAAAAHAGPLAGEAGRALVAQALLASQFRALGRPFSSRTVRAGRDLRQPVRIAIHEDALQQGPDGLIAVQQYLEALGFGSLEEAARSGAAQFELVAEPQVTPLEVGSVSGGIVLGRATPGSERFAALQAKSRAWTEDLERRFAGVKVLVQTQADASREPAEETVRLIISGPVAQGEKAIAYARARQVMERANAQSGGTLALQPEWFEIVLADERFAARVQAEQARLKAALQAEIDALKREQEVTKRHEFVHRELDKSQAGGADSSVAEDLARWETAAQQADGDLAQVTEQVRQAKSQRWAAEASPNVAAVIGPRAWTGAVAQGSVVQVVFDPAAPGTVRSAAAAVHAALEAVADPGRSLMPDLAQELQVDISEAGVIIPQALAIEEETAGMLESEEQVGGET